MPACSGNFQSPFRMFLPFDIPIVVVIHRATPEQDITIAPRWLDHGRTLDKRDGFGKCVKRVHRDISYQGGFLAVGCRENQAVMMPTGHADRQCTGNWLNVSVKGEFANKHALADALRRYHFLRHENADRDGQVKGGSFFFDSSWCEIDRDSFCREMKPGILQGRSEER